MPRLSVVALTAAIAGFASERGVLADVVTYPELFPGMDPTQRIGVVTCTFTFDNAVNQFYVDRRQVPRDSGELLG